MSRPFLEMGKKELSVAAFSKSLIPGEEGKSLLRSIHGVAKQYSEISNSYDENALNRKFAESLASFSLDFVSFDSNEAI